MSKRQSLAIKVTEYGELRESVKQRLQRIREAFSDANTHASKKDALAKMIEDARSQTPRGAVL